MGEPCRTDRKRLYEKLEGDSRFDLHISEHYKAVHIEVYFPNDYSWGEAFEYNNSDHDHGEKH